MDEKRAIIVATDLSPACDGAVEHAAELAATTGAPLVLAHVIGGHVMLPWHLWRAPTAHERAAADHDARRGLARLAHRFVRRPVRSACVVVHGDPREQIAVLAQRLDAQLIVLAQARCYFDSAVEKVLRDSDVPVLVTPRGPRRALFCAQPAPSA
jgi:nucleotide-binding universal stress UspA family protein